MIKIYQGKGGAYVTFERLTPSGMWLVQLRTGAGELADKVRCDDYRDAIAYRKSFLRIARKGVAA